MIMQVPDNELVASAIIDVYMAINKFQDLVYVPRHEGGNPPVSHMVEECIKRVWAGESINVKPVNNKKHLQFMLDMMQVCLNNMED